MTAAARAISVAVCLLGSATAALGQHEDIAIFSTADGGGELTTPYGFAAPQQLTPSLPGGLCPGGVCPYSSTNPGFDSADADLPVESLFALDPGTQVSFVVRAIQAGASVKFGAAILDAAGESAVIGTTDLHVHPTWQVQAPVGVMGNWTVTFTLTTTAPSYTQSADYTLTLTNIAVPTPTRTATATRTSTATQTPTASQTATAAASATATPPAEHSPTPTSTATVTVTATLGAAACAPTPRDCAASGRAVLKLRGGDPARRALTFKWLKGSIASPAAFGDPTLSTLALCLYADATPIAAYAIDAGGAWRSTRRGFAHALPGGNAAGIDKVILASGDGRARLLARGRGASLPVPLGNLPLPSASVIAAQIVRDDGGCWGAVFAPPFQRNDEQAFTAHD